MNNLVKNIVENLTGNPTFILLGFLCSVIGTVEIIVSLIIKFKNRKENKQFDENAKKVLAHFSEEVDFSETTNKLEKVQEELKKAQKQLEIELPKERKQAILKEKLAYEERVLDEAKVSVQKLKDELQLDAKENKSIIQKIILKIKTVLASKETASLARLSTLLMVAIYLSSFFFKGNIIKVSAYFCIIICFLYVTNTYEELKKEKWKKAISAMLNLFVCCYFFSIVYYDYTIKELPVWNILVVITLLFAHEEMSKGFNIYNLNLIGHFLTMIMIGAIIVIRKYENRFAVAALLIESFLIVINIIGISQVIKKKDK